MEFVVDKKIQRLIPPLSDAEFAGLTEQIVANGCRDALVVWKEKGILLDGHNRFAICTEHNIKYKTVSMSFESRADAEIWMIRHQLDRRNIALFQKAELALLLKPLLAEKAKANQSHGKTAPGKTLMENSTEALDTRDELAAIAGVSNNTISRVEVLTKEADDETLKELRSGETSVNAAYCMIRRGPLKQVHVSNNSGNNEWYTPAEYVEAAREAMGGIDTDPASSKIANRTVRAKKFFTELNSGLDAKWGNRVWMNPPYSQPLIHLFADALASKYLSGEVQVACVLVNNATETEWFNTLSKESSAICFPRGRIRFLDTDGNPGGAPLQGQAIIYLGENRYAFDNYFSEFGEVFYRD